jgi:alkylation response protein AidB-like acyl-CoA dehydrogenase
MVERAISYVTDRKQFGSPVGSFQAVKHIIANAATSLHNGRAVTYLAASSVERNDDSADHDVACARIFTGEHYLRGSEQLIQVHGGFGFTWEAGIHLWYRNAMANMHQPDRPADLASLRL